PAAPAGRPAGRRGHGRRPAAQRARLGRRCGRRLLLQRRDRARDAGALLRQLHRAGPAAGPAAGGRQGARVRLRRGTCRVVPGAAGQGRAEGRRRRGQPVGRVHVHAAVRHQLRRDRDLSAGRPAEGAVTSTGASADTGTLARPLRPFVRLWRGAGGALDDLGRQATFYARTIGWTYRVLLRYKKEVIRLLSEVAFGTGALAVIGGTVVIVVFMTFFTGLEVGQQGYSSLNQLGAAVYTGFISAYVNTREIAPIIAGIALSATVGAGFTAQLGAMRASEEIDALETLGIPSIPFLVTSRLIAGMLAVIPLY